MSLFDQEKPLRWQSETCRTCEHRQAWECGSKVIQYCGTRPSLRTDNGLLKIKAKNPACPFWKERMKR